MNKHYAFIQESIINLIRETVEITMPCCDSVEYYPLSEYIAQTLFLRMTGFNEQKIKCILWELATDDYDFRYKFLSTSYGECSSLSHKNNALKALYCDQMKLNSFNHLIIEVKDECKLLFEDSVFSIWWPRDYDSFQIVVDELTDKWIENSYKEDNRGVLFRKKSNFWKCYERVYNHRNRCAHNLLSYQDNLPTLSAMSSEEYEKYDNWFVRYYVLALIDAVFVEAYNIYINNRKVF